MSTMTREEREAARARCDAATDGPRKYMEGTGTITDINGKFIATGVWPNDAPLIIHARADISRALDTIDALEAEVADLRELLDTLVYWHDQGHIDESWWSAARAATRRRP